MGKWENYKLYITPAKICCQLSGKKLCIGAGDIDTAIKICTDKINAFFPLFHFLNFIKN